MSSMSKLQVTIAKLLVYSLITVVIGPSTAKAGYIYTTIRDPNTNSTVAFGINNSGHIVGSGYSGGAYVYNGGVFTYFDFSVATGINNSGQIVFYSNQNGGKSFVGSGSNYTTVDVPGADLTYAGGINDGGDVAGYYNETHDVGGVPTIRQHGFVKSGGVYRTIDAPGAIYTQASGINNSGQVAGTFYDGTTYKGFIENSGVFTILDHYPSGTYVYGINNLGDVVGYYEDPGQNDEAGGAFVMSGGVYTRIEVPDRRVGNSYTQAWGINDLGQVVGWYISASEPGAYSGFLATPDGSNAVVPEPSMSVVASALLGLGYVWRRRKSRQVVTDSDRDNPA